MKYSAPPKAYSALQIGVAACIGGPLAGAWLLLQTRQALSQPRHEGEIWLTAFVYTGFILTFYALLPVSLRTALAGLPALLSGITCGVWARAAWGSQPIRAVDSQAQGTWWGAVGRGIVIGLLCLSILAACVFLYRLGAATALERIHS